jgi:3-hydroxybutyryl-CoA dehydratase
VSVKAGDVLTARRTFSIEDVEAFTRVSGDRGAHHLQKDAEGRLLVHGLLTATIPTEIGGSINFIARVMHFEFVRPVFTGDTIECACTVDEAVEGKLKISLECKNQHGKVVLSGWTSGVIR